MVEVKTKICGQKPGSKAVCSLYMDYKLFGVKVCTCELQCPDQVNAVVTVRSDSIIENHEEKEWNKF